jgi:hypothetical protein
MVCSSSTNLNNIGFDEYGIQTNLKLIFLDLMTSKLIMLFSIHVFKYLYSPKSLPIHLQPRLMKYFDNVNVYDFLYAPKFW